MKKFTALLIGMSLFLGMSGIADAALLGMIYDNDLDLWWLNDANYAKTSGWDADGLMTWNEAQTWVDHLNSTELLGFNDWRLPTSVNSDGSGPNQGANIIGSEMGHLYYTELGNTSGSGGFTNSGPFLNIGYRYWSSPMVPDGWGYNPSQDGSYYFIFNDTSDPGEQWFLPTTQEMGVWVVSAGTPEPTSILLLGSGLAWLSAFRKRRTNV